MKKILLAALLIGMMGGCVDASKRINHLKKLYPHCKVEPATGLIQHSGYEFIVIDTNNQIIAVDFYSVSETKIYSLRNIR